MHPIGVLALTGEPETPSHWDFGQKRAWREIHPKATAVQTACVGSHLPELFQAANSALRGRRSRSSSPAPEPGLPAKSDEVCFIPSTSFLNIYML